MRIWESIASLLFLAAPCWRCCGFASCGGWSRRSQSTLALSLAKSGQKLSIRGKRGDTSQSILLVENDNNLRKALGKFLAKGGYHVTGVSDARSAISICRGIVRPINPSRTRFKLDPNFTQQSGELGSNSTHMSSMIPDCLIIDIQLSGSMDGLGLLRVIRSDPLLSSLPVVVLTAKGKVEDRIIGYECDADAYLPKPFEPEELMSIVDALLLRDNTVSVSRGANRLTAEQTENAKTSVVYADLKRELTEIKSLLNLPSGVMSTATGETLQGDILEIKNKLKDIIVDQTPQDVEPTRDQYDTLSILSPGESMFVSMLYLL
jgi:DNA-binding response OmpR family regulator